MKFRNNRLQDLEGCCHPLFHIQFKFWILVIKIPLKLKTKFRELHFRENILGSHFLFLNGVKRVYFFATFKHTFLQREFHQYSKTNKSVALYSYLLSSFFCFIHWRIKLLKLFKIFITHSLSHKNLWLTLFMQ